MGQPLSDEAMKNDVEEYSQMYKDVYAKLSIQWKK